LPIKSCKIKKSQNNGLVVFPSKRFGLSLKAESLAAGLADGVYSQAKGEQQ
jgi:hypothetical protein